jgi:hypothetical protein
METQLLVCELKRKTLSLEPNIRKTSIVLDQNLPVDILRNVKMQLQSLFLLYCSCCHCSCNVRLARSTFATHGRLAATF